MSAPDAAAQSAAQSAAQDGLALDARAIQAASRAVAKTGKRWEDDDAAVARVALVRELMAQGIISDRQIARALAARGIIVDRRTIATDKGRLRTLRKREIGLDFDGDLLTMLDTLYRILREAWTSFNQAKKGSRDASEHLTVILATSESIAKYQGLLPADRRAEVAESEEASASVGSFLASLARHDQAYREQLLADADDDALTPQDRPTRQLIEGAYEIIGIPPPPADGGEGDADDEGADADDPDAIHADPDGGALPADAALAKALGRHEAAAAREARRVARAAQSAAPPAATPADDDEGVSW